MTNASVWESAQNALIAGDESALEALLREHEQLFRERRPPAYGPEPGRLAPDYSAGDTRAIIVRNHHFESWARFAEHIDALTRPDCPVALFEMAVDAGLRTGAGLGGGRLAALPAPRIELLQRGLAAGGPLGRRADLLVRRGYPGGPGGIVHVRGLQQLPARGRLAQPA